MADSGEYQVMEKYGTKSPVMKFVHKNTGYIIAGIALAIITPLYLSIQEEQEFFEKWSCEKINQYYLSGDAFIGFPSYSELDEKQAQRFDQIINECGVLDMFPHD